MAPAGPARSRRSRARERGQPTGIQRLRWRARRRARTRTARATGERDFGTSPDDNSARAGILTLVSAQGASEEGDGPLPRQLRRGRVVARGRVVVETVL